MAEDKPSLSKEKKVGVVTHYFTKIGVAIIKMSGEIKTGDEIHIKGHTSDFTQKVDSMQIDKKPLDVAKKGQSIGLKVKEHARETDEVYKAKK